MPVTLQIYLYITQENKMLPYKALQIFKFFRFGLLSATWSTLTNHKKGERVEKVQKLQVQLVSQHAMETIIFLWTVLITFKHLQNNHSHIHDWPGDTVHAAIWVISKGVWLGRWENLNFHSVVVLQLPDLPLVAVDLALQTFNLLFVVVNFLLVMLLQRSQLLLLLTPYVQMDRYGGGWQQRSEKKGMQWEKRGREQRKRHKQREIRTIREDHNKNNIWWLISPWLINKETVERTLKMHTWSTSPPQQPASSPWLHLPLWWTLHRHHLSLHLYPAHPAVTQGGGAVKREMFSVTFRDNKGFAL